jgi:hypothetical protein
MKMRIYLTHCCAKKDDTLKGTGQKVSPERLYIARPTQRFMKKCTSLGVRWAIFSDYYGVWFPEIEREWYGDDVGDPNGIKEPRLTKLIEGFDKTLEQSDEIFFYYNPGRFHPFYAELLERTVLKPRIQRITHLWDIV